MAGLMFLLLPLSVLLVVVVAVAAFLEAAFREPRLLSVHETGQRNSSPRGKMSTMELSASLQRLTGTPAISIRQAACTCESFIPSVTEPEAVAIADELERRGNGDLQIVMERARHCDASCPMLTKTGLCACAITRPLACIGRCVVGGDSPEWAAGLGESVSEAFRRHLDSRHVNSSTRRLDEALVSLLDKPKM